VSTTQPVRVGGVSLGEGRAKIIVPLMPRSVEEVPAAVAALDGLPVDLVEWRMDHVPASEDVPAVGAALRAATALPVLATYRTDREGGLGTLPDDAYAALVADVAVAGLADAVDVEYRRAPNAVATVFAAARPAGVPVLASFHDFTGTPTREALLGHLRAQAELGADVLKVAVTPRTGLDVAELLAACAAASAEFAAPVLAISMGSLGLVSRVAGATFGSCATFATAGAASAPGQIPAGELAPLLGLFRP